MAIKLANLLDVSSLEEQLAASKRLQEESLQVTVTVASKGSFVATHQELKSGLFIGRLNSGKGMLEVVHDGEERLFVPLDNRKVEPQKGEIYLPPLKGSVYLEFSEPAEAQALAHSLDEGFEPGINGGRAASLKLRVSPRVSRTVASVNEKGEEIVSLGLRVLAVEGVGPAGSETLSADRIAAGLLRNSTADQEAVALRQATRKANREAAAQAMAKAAAEAAAKAAPPATPKARSKRGGGAAAAKALQKGMSGASDTL